MTIKAPSGRTYEWKKDTPPTEKDWQEITAYDALSNEVQASRDIMASEQSSPIEKVAAVAPYAFYKGRDLISSMGARAVSAAAGQEIGQRIGGAPGRMVGGAIAGGIPAMSEQMNNAGINVADVGRVFMADPQQFIEKLDAGLKGGSIKPGRFIGDVVAAANPTRSSIVNAAGNVVAGNLESVIDTGRPLTPKEDAALASAGMVGATASRLKTGKIASAQERLFEERMRPFRDLRKEGFVINPDEIGASTYMGSRLAGKAMLGQTASQRNQYGVQRLSREDLGLSKEAVPFRPDKLVGGKIVPGELEVVIKESYGPYEQIKAISERAKKEGERFFKISDPHESAVMRSTPEGQKLLVEAAAEVDNLKEARIAERDAWRRLKSNEPNAYDAWKQAKESVKTLDDRITAAAESAGDPQLAERLKGARQKIAKAYAYLNATDKTTGLVDLRDLAAQFNDDAFLTGNARRMAEFYNAFSRNAQEAVRGQPPGGEHLGINFAAVSAAQGNPVGMTLAGVPFMRGPASRAIFSEFAQNRFAQPRMQLGPEDFSAALLRFAPQTASRGMIKDEDLQRFLKNQPPVRFNRPQ